MAGHTLSRRSVFLAPVAILAHRWTAGATTVQQYCADPEEVRFLDLLNQYRASKGIAGLALSQTLGAAAEHHALDMATTHTLSHTMSDGTDWLQNIINHEYPYTFRSENIAWGYRTAEQVLGAWQGSDGHNTNMLRTGFGATGIARRFDENGNAFWVNTFGCCLDTNAAICAVPSPTSTPVPQPTPTERPKKCRGRGNPACQAGVSGTAPSGR